MPYNNIRARIERHARNVGLFAAFAATLISLAIALMSDNHGSIPLIILGGLLVAALVWLLCMNTTIPLERDVTSMTEKLREYNRGNKSARVWGSNIPELRALSEQINRMASEGEAAIIEVREDDQRESDFVSDVSHELRTPLTSIRGAAETLLDGDVDAEDQARFLNMIISESSRLTRLANDLLTLQRIEGGTGEINLSRFSIEEAVQRAEATLLPIIEANHIEYETFGEPEEVLGDIDRIQQVVVNLVENATRAVGPDGHIWIDYGVAERDELGSLLNDESTADVEEFAYFSIFDDGPGIPANNRARIFDRFSRQQYSRDRKSGGSGLGLSIVQAIVKSHGGAVHVRFGADEVRMPDAHSVAPPPEFGCCFTVYLPIPPEPDIARIRRMSPPEPQEQKRLRIHKRRPQQ